MGYFPFFIDIKGKKIVIVGGGKVAIGKLQRLLPYEPDITVIAPIICDEMLHSEGISIVRREFADEDINGAFAVIAATDDNELNAHIYKLCAEKKILINTVDDKEKCSFIFPALVHRDEITVGISTSGKSPLFARYLRQYIEEELDDSKINALSILGSYREYVKSRFPTEVQRKEAFNAIFDLCLVCGENAPDNEEIKQLLERVSEKYEA